MRGETNRGVLSGGKQPSHDITADMETATAVRKLIDRLELYGQTFRDEEAFKLSGECWAVLQAVAKLNQITYSGVCKAVDTAIKYTVTDDDELQSCGHTRIACPNHKGSWDCTPFCSICEAEQEYCPICSE